MTTVYRSAPDSLPKLSDLKQFLLSPCTSIPCSLDVLALLGSRKNPYELRVTGYWLDGWFGSRIAQVRIVHHAAVVSGK